MEAEVKMMQPQAKEHLEPQEAGRSKNYPPLKPPKEYIPANILVSDFWSPELQENTFLLI